MELIGWIQQSGFGQKQEGNLGLMGRSTGPKSGVHQDGWTAWNLAWRESYRVACYCSFFSYACSLTFVILIPIRLWKLNCVDHGQANRPTCHAARFQREQHSRVGASRKELLV